MIPGSPNGLVDAGDALAQAASNLDATRTSIVRQARLVDDGWIGAAYEVAAREMATGQSQQNALVVLALDPATAQLRQQATQALPQLSWMRTRPSRAACRRIRKQQRGSRR